MEVIETHRQKTAGPFVAHATDVPTKESTLSVPAAVVDTILMGR